MGNNLIKSNPKTIADLDIDFIFQKCICPSKFEAEFRNFGNVDLANLKIKPGHYYFQLFDDVSDFEYTDEFRIMIETRTSLPELIGRLNNVIIALRNKTYALHKFVVRFSDCFDIHLIEMPF